MNTLISFDLHADMGFFKKLDVNESLYLTYNMLHKPALLGILGAILGYRGFEKNSVWPEYYEKLKDLPISIEPLEDHHEKGNFTKSVIAYNNSVGYASQEAGGNLIVKEQTLVSPAFRCYVLLNESDDHKRLANYLSACNAEYVPYLGKNEFTAWWENPKQHDFHEFTYDQDFLIRSLFVKEFIAKDQIIKTKAEFGSIVADGISKYMYFERLPIKYNENLFQYELAEFGYTNWLFKKESRLKDLYSLDGVDGLIQLI